MSESGRVSLKKVKEGLYEVYYSIGKKVGTFEKQIDGYYVYYPEKDPCAWASHSLREIADKLDEINKHWDEVVRKGLEETPEPSDASIE